jgi:hypothetical protein
LARKVSLVLSHWYHLFEGMQESPKRFYDLLYQAVDLRKIPDIKILTITYREGGLLSAKRVYFRVQRKEHLFDICAAPFGANAFFVSWWLGEAPGFLWELILKIPFLGEAIMRIFRPFTYYRLDSALMFQELVRSAVLEVVDQISEAKGVRMLSELERKPIMSSFFQK